MATRKFEKPANGETVDGAWQGPMWCPQFADMKDNVAKVEMEQRTKHPKSFFDSAIRGKLRTADAWGRPHYVLDIDGELFLLPEHATLYGRLGRVKLGADVYLERGPKKAVGNEGNSTFTYVCVVADKSAALTSMRADALYVKGRGKDD